MRLNPWLYPVCAALYFLANICQAQTQLQAQFASQAIWDSNFARALAEVEEQYLRTDAQLAVSHNSSNQDLQLRLSGSYLDYQTREDLDTDLYQGMGRWRSRWQGNSFSELRWQLDSYAVDRLEFYGLDVVAQDNYLAQLGWGQADAMQLLLGVAALNQRHSSEQRQMLEFNERDSFVHWGQNTELLASPGVMEAYAGGPRSGWAATAHTGQRRYAESAQGEFDFDFNRAELQAAWWMKTKLRLDGKLDFIQRRGELNQSSGRGGELRATWLTSDKWRWQLAYSQSQPALGETQDSPQKLAQLKLDVHWRINRRWQFSAYAARGEQDYDAQSEAGQPDIQARSEQLLSFSPVNLQYQLGDGLSWQLQAAWNKRESPLAYRQFHYSQVTCGLSWQF